MSIPLIGSPAPFSNVLLDLIVGDSRDFAASLGSWVRTGGTSLARDTTYKLTGAAASAKFVTTAGTGQYIELPISGTFKAGETYWALVALSLEAGTGVNFDLVFGLIGTDSGTKTAVVSGTAGLAGIGDGNFTLHAIQWTPTANRTGVKLRLNQATAVASAWHVGLALAGRSSGKYSGPALIQYDNKILMPVLNSGGTPTDTSFSPWFGGSRKGLDFNDYGGLSIRNFNEKSGLSLHYDIGWYAWAESAGAEGDKSTAGYNFDVGDDYVGFYIGELNTTHTQWFPYDNQFNQLRDAGTAGWSHSRDADAGAVDGKIEDSFQWAFYVAGALTAGTNQAAYFQVPAKCRIDEVRIHVGTSPTGSSLIVDVNDDGVTVFSTQGNRPEIAISGTDDTSGVADGGTTIAENSVLSIDIDQVGSTIAGSDLAIFVRGRMIW